MLKFGFINWIFPPLASALLMFWVNIALADDSVAATINGMEISKASVDILVKQAIEKEGKKDGAELRKQAIDKLATQLLVSQEAAKMGLDQRPDVLEQIKLTKQSILASAFVHDYMAHNPVSDTRLKAEYDKIGATENGAMLNLSDAKARLEQQIQKQDLKKLIDDLRAKSKLVIKD